jgi:hypothetical protein
MIEFGKCPSPELWKKRMRWLEEQLADAETGFSYVLSEHATTLFMDMELAFCAGAWVSVITMSISVIDAHLRETEAMNNNIGTAKLLTDFYAGTDIDWLRRLRNRYVHHNIDSPTIETNDWYSNQEVLEEQATKAVQMTITALYQSPGI